MLSVCAVLGVYPIQLATPVANKSSRRHKTCPIFSCALYLLNVALMHRTHALTVPMEGNGGRSLLRASPAHRWQVSIQGSQNPSTSCCRAYLGPSHGRKMAKIGPKSVYLPNFGRNRPKTHPPTPIRHTKVTGRQLDDMWTTAGGQLEDGWTTGGRQTEAKGGGWWFGEV